MSNNARSCSVPIPCPGTCDLCSDICQLQDQTQQEDTSNSKAYAALKDRIEMHLVRGELDIAQYDHLEKRLSE